MKIEIHDRSIEFLKKSKLKIQRIAAAAGLTMALTASATMFSGCGRNTTADDYSYSTVYEILDITHNGIDYGKKNINTEELDNMYKQALKDKDKDTGNQIIEALGTDTLKQLAAEGYNLDENKIKDFEVIESLHKEQTDNKNVSVTEYGISFKYDGKSYNIEANGDSESYIHKLCAMIRAAHHGELELTEDECDTDLKYLNIPNAYNYIKESLMTSLEYDNEAHQNEYDSGKGPEYDGYFKLKDNDDKIDLVEKNLNENDKVEEETTIKDNNLPNK